MRSVSKGLEERQGAQIGAPNIGPIRQSASRRTTGLALTRRFGVGPGSARSSMQTAPVVLAPPASPATAGSRPRDPLCRIGRGRSIWIAVGYATLCDVAGASIVARTELLSRKMPEPQHAAGVRYPGGSHGPSRSPSGRANELRHRPQARLPLGLGEGFREHDPAPSLPGVPPKRSTSSLAFKRSYQDVLVALGREPCHPFLVLTHAGGHQPAPALGRKPDVAVRDLDTGRHPLSRPTPTARAGSRRSHSGRRPSLRSGAANLPEFEMWAWADVHDHPSGRPQRKGSVP